ncbi:hypothetical protein H9L13_06050 [Sphingomonas lutea]|uniref:Putative Flp pilus-assembly TadG-like N-terminal domain-containing protein n=1 Tax=Sphingomonas lutea TaxID=1045317 RepID=A0A7G9SKP1_9SPHN|nr:pilus assembly protein TadG-related protein [Sphingomonas lutea]QNN68416.1 hypothetical protein H9L13_06050 [Sphingomonas lutea]
MTFWKRLIKDKRGNALVLAGAALPLVIGSAGLASDTIQWALWKRQLQRAADSAALAGTYARVQNNAGQTAAQAVANDLTRNNHVGFALLNPQEVTFPTSGSWTNGVRVELEIQKRLSFSSLFLPNPPIIRAAGTAATIATGVYCVVSLIDSGVTGITSTGNSTLNLGCGMITNSNSLSAAIATGSSQVHATPVAAVGNVPPSSHWNGAELLPYTVKQEDPYATKEPPKPFGPCQGSASRLRNNPGNTIDRTADPAGSVQCVSEIDIKGTLNLGSATYVIDGGNFSAGGQAKISCTGCTIILSNSSGGSTANIGTVDINAGAEIKMTAPTSGTYKEILFFQDRRAPQSTTITNKINGNSNSVMSGAFYFPNQALDINGTANLNFTCAKFVSYIVSFSGNGSINNTCTGGYGGGAIMGKHVRLVA